MANIGLSNASYRAVLASNNWAKQSGNHTAAIATNRNEASGVSLSADAAMSDNFFLDATAATAGIKSMSVALGYLGTANAAIENASTTLSKVYELSVLAANSTNTDADNAGIDAEIEALMDQFHRTMSETQYKGKAIFDDRNKDMSVHSGQTHTVMEFGIGSIDYDDLYDHTNPGQNYILPGNTYEVKNALSDDQKAAILSKTTGITADQLVPGFQFTTDTLPEPVTPAVTPVADTSSIGTEVANMGLLQNMLVKAGINATTGTLGSGESTAPGLMFDSTGTGTFNNDYDYLTPGTPFEGFAVKIDGDNSNNNNANNVANIVSTSFTDLNDSLVWTGTLDNGWTIKHTYTLGKTENFINIQTEITAATDANSLTFGRFIDPDAQAVAGDTSATDNVTGYGTIPQNNIVFSEATSSQYALGLYSTDENVTSGVNNWNQQADSYNGTSYAGGTYGTGDDTMGMSWDFGSVVAGQTVTANYAYTFGIGAYQAARDAYNGGAGGGRDVTGGQGVANVGSATEAAQANFGGNVMYAPSLDMATSASDAIGLGNTHLVTEKIEALQNKLNQLRVKINSNYFVLENAINIGTDLSSEYARGVGTISDINFSREAAELAKKQVMENASTAILAQANKGQQFILSLIS